MTLKEARAEFFLKSRIEGLEKIRQAIESGDDKDEIVTEMKEKTKALIRRLEEHAHGRKDRKEPIDTKSLMDEEGVLASDDVVLLRRMRKEDHAMYHQLFMEQEVNPQEEAIEGIFESNLSDENLYCTIFTVADGTPIGYCGIKYVDEDPAELAVELLKAYHRQGFGYRALWLYMDALKKAGVQDYIAMIDADNVASQRLFEKLGARLCGLTEYMLYTKEERDKFEEMFASLVSPNMEQLAQRLSTKPKKLLSRAVKYELSA